MSSNQHSCIVSKDEWNIKKDTVKNVLYVLQYAKRHLLGWSTAQKDVLDFYFVIFSLYYKEFCVAVKEGLKYTYVHTISFHP